MAVIFALVFFGALGIIGQGIIGLQDETSTRVQMKHIALNIAEIISSSQVLNELNPNSGFEIEYITPLLSVPTEGKTNCTITISLAAAPAESAVQVKYATDPAETAKFIAPSGIKVNNLPSGASLACGDQLIVSK